MDWKAATIHPEIQPYVRSIGILSSPTLQFPIRNLPSGSIQILAQLSDESSECHDGTKREISGPQISVIGQRSKYSIYKPSAGTRILCIDFFSHGASVFFREPLASLNESSVDAGELWRQSNILARLCEAENDTVIFQTVQDELRLRMRRDVILKGKLTLLKSAAYLLSTGKMRSITTLARDSGIHRRQLERLFKEYVGLSPAAYARIQRITNAASMISSPHGFRALEYALDHGYYDQAHFNHDFKAVVGLSPTDYRNSSNPS